MQPSPYTPGQPPVDLAGREPQLRQITDLLIRPALHARPAPTPLVIVGADGMGRSSLLLRAADDASRFGMAELMVRCGTGEKLPTGEDLLLHFAEAQRAGAPGIAVLIDDLDRVDGEPAQLLRSWGEALDGGLIGVLIATGGPTTLSRLTDGGVAADRILVAQLDPLRGDELQRAFTGPADRARVSWQQAALQEMTRRSGGNPARVQQWAAAMWEAAGHPDPGGLISAEVVEAAQKLMDRADRPDGAA